MMKNSVLLAFLGFGLVSCSKNDAKPTGPVTETYSVHATYHKYYTNPEVDTTYASTLQTVEHNDTMTVSFYTWSGSQYSVTLNQKRISNDTIYYATNHAYPFASIRIHPASSSIFFFWEWDETYVGQQVKENYKISN